MRRALSLAVFGAILSGDGCSVQTNKAPEAAVRQEIIPAPVGSASAPAFEAHPLPYNLARFEYPRIEVDSRVTFQFTAPDARKVQVALVTSGQGSLQPLPYDMVKSANGVWTYTGEPQAPGYHNCWMLVDGAVVLDPATDAFIGYGHMCNAFEIPEPGVNYYDLKDVPHGSVVIKGHFSKTTNAWRHIYAYTPPATTLALPPAARFCICSTEVARISGFGSKWAELT